MSSNVLYGKATIRVDGKVIPTENRATFNPGGYKREPERHGGKTYFTQNEEAPRLEVSILQNSAFDEIALNKIDNATITFMADTGQKRMLRKAFTVEPVAFDASGKARAIFSGEAEAL